MGSGLDGDDIALARRERQNMSGEIVSEKARTTPVLRECEILVVGGGPAGTAAAIAAARAGADVVLLERYNHLGGLSTGGLVIWIDRMTDWSGRLVIEGVGGELLARLPAAAVAGPGFNLHGSNDVAAVEHWRRRSSAHHGVVTWAPTVNPEHLKLESQRMVSEAGVTLMLHGFGVSPLMADDGSVAGVFVESKEGRQAIRAKVVIDCTGDGDIFHRAGARSDSDIEASSIHHCMNTSWLFGGVDMPNWFQFRYGEPEAFAAFSEAGRSACGGVFERPVVSWRDDVALFMGPRISGLSGVDLLDLTQAEIVSRRYMSDHLDFYRAHAPGFANADLLQTGSQLGVRHTRRLAGVHRVVRDDWLRPRPFDDEIGVSPSLAPKWPNLSIPYGCLLPERLDGLLAAGRHVACDPSSHSILREIPQCWVTGQAAGVAAAVALQSNRSVRDVDRGRVRNVLCDQGVFLHPRGTAVPEARATHG